MPRVYPPEMQKAAAKKRPQTFKPGQSGNPNGRPPRIKYTSEYLALLLQGDAVALSAQWKKGPLTGAMIVAIALFAKMGRGDLTAIKEGLDRVEGRVPQPLEHSGTENGAPMRFTVHFDKPEAEAAKDTAI